LPVKVSLFGEPVSCSTAANVSAPWLAVVRGCVRYLQAADPPPRGAGRGPAPGQVRSGGALPLLGGWAGSPPRDPATLCCTSTRRVAWDGGALSRRSTSAAERRLAHPR
jgi:hypothetical protein